MRLHIHEQCRAFLLDGNVFVVREEAGAFLGIDECPGAVGSATGLDAINGVGVELGGAHAGVHDGWADGCEEYRKEGE